MDTLHEFLTSMAMGLPSPWMLAWEWHQGNGRPAPLSVGWAPCSQRDEARPHHTGHPFPQGPGLYAWVHPESLPRDLSLLPGVSNSRQFLGLKWELWSSATDGNFRSSEGRAAFGGWDVTVQRSHCIRSCSLNPKTQQEWTQEDLTLLRRYLALLLSGNRKLWGWGKAERPRGEERHKGSLETSYVWVVFCSDIFSIKNCGGGIMM